MSCRDARGSLSRRSRRRDRHSPSANSPRSRSRAHAKSGSQNQLPARVGLLRQRRLCSFECPPVRDTEGARSSEPGHVRPPIKDKTRQRGRSCTCCGTGQSSCELRIHQGVCPGGARWIDSTGWPWFTNRTSKSSDSSGRTSPISSFTPARNRSRSCLLEKAAFA